MDKLINRVKNIFMSKWILFVIIIFATGIFWRNSDNDFQFDSESLVISMVTAGRYNFDIGNRQFGLGEIATIEGDAYEVHANPTLYDNSISEREQQIGLQGWVFYFITWIGVPGALSISRLLCCLALAIVLTLICYELKKRYGLLFAGSFFIVSISSSWITNFAPNLYWVTFTWFIPMLLGLICLNNLNKRLWLYPVFFLAILIRAACGYEYITVIMLSSIMFLVVEWLCAIKRDKQHSKLLFRTIFMVGIMSLLGFVVAILIHSYMRGDGNVLSGLNAIYRQDVSRRTFGNAEDFYAIYTSSLNASIVDVLIIYLGIDYAGMLARRLLTSAAAIFFFKHIVKRQALNTEFWLLVVSFSACISWFVLAKSHSYLHPHMNYVMWYLGFIQVSVYLMIKAIMQLAFSDKGKQLLRDLVQRLRKEVYLDI